MQQKQKGKISEVFRATAVIRLEYRPK